MDIKAGDKARFTGSFLKSTGQQKGGEGSKRFTVTAVQGSFAIVDERHAPDYAQSMWTEAELTADPSLWFRRINVKNLQRIK